MSAKLAEILFTRGVLLATVVTVLCACSSAPKEQVVHHDAPISTFSPNNKAVFFPSESALYVANKSPSLGLSLSGGGMRSAMLSVGILSGLHDSGVLPKLDYLSTVSGGGYAANWYISALTYLQQNPNMQAYRRKSLEDMTGPAVALYSRNVDLLFNDCYPVHQRPYLGTVNHLVSKNCINNNDKWQNNYRFQTQIAQQSDFLFYFKDGHSSPWRWPLVKAIRIGEWASILGAHVLSLPLHHFSNTLFDWNIPLSPLKFTYNSGIERAFGLMPIDLTYPSVNGKRHANNSSFVGMTNYSASNLSFASIKQAMVKNTAACSSSASANEPCYQIPMWIINTAANKTRSLCGGSATDSGSKGIFEFTPFSYGSEQNGYVHKPYSKLSVSDAVQISGAAIDSQYGLFSGQIGATALYAFNANLGEKIPNYHPNSPVRSIADILPYPFYCEFEKTSVQESKDIYLSDGAHVEHTGAYSLILRGVDNIIMVDASEDELGKWMEIKKLARILLHEHQLTLHINGIYTDLLTNIGLPKDEVVMSPRNASENIFTGSVSGFSDGYIQGSNDRDQNKINIVFVKAGMVKTLLSENCDNEDMYPCSVTRYYKSSVVSSIDQCIQRTRSLFPHNSTTFMSVNLSTDMYMAYRDLGRYIAKRISLDKNGQLRVAKLGANIGTDIDLCQPN